MFTGLKQKQHIQYDVNAAISSACNTPAINTVVTLPVFIKQYILFCFIYFECNPFSEGEKPVVVFFFT